VACAEVVVRATGLDVRIKPVNDLVLEEHKLGGILTEAVIEQGRPTVLMTGVGLNVKAAPRMLPPTALPAVSLQDVLAPEQFAHLDRTVLAASLASAIHRWNRVVEEDIRALHAEWERYRTCEPGLLASAGRRA
jgi:biotin-(acetyl-CoA carboxylase) ligase